MRGRAGLDRGAPLAAGQGRAGPVLAGAGAY